jgi:multidrug resistance efflux pump
MKRRYLLFTGLVITLVMVVMSDSRLTEAQTAARPVPIPESSHFIKPQKVLVLSAEVDGVITQAKYEPQEFVRRGDILVQLDAKLVEIEIERLGKQVELNTSKEKAEIVLAFSKSNFDIIQELYDKKVGEVRVGSPKELEDARQRYEMAKLGDREASLELEELQLNLQRSTEILKKHTIRAPWDGVIVPFSSVKNVPGVESAKKVEVAETVRTGTPVRAMMKVDRLRISLPLPVEQLNTIQLGQKANVFVQDTAEPISAEVVFVSPTVASTGQFNIEVEFANPPVEADNLPRGFYRYKYRPGMRARVQWVLDS